MVPVSVASRIGGPLGAATSPFVVQMTRINAIFCYHGRLVVHCGCVLLDFTRDYWQKKNTRTFHTGTR